MANIDLILANLLLDLRVSHRSVGIEALIWALERSRHVKTVKTS